MGHPDHHFPDSHNKNYFDDFISLATESESQPVDFTVKAVLRMLGWKFAEDGPKAPPFSPKVTALGVAIDVSRLHQGLTLIDNTEKRTAELSETIAAFTDSGRMSKKDALRLRGRMQFASGQVFGRVAKRCSASVTQRAYEAGDGRMPEALRSSPTIFFGLIQIKIPRSLSTKSTSTSFIFTDASREPDAERTTAGIGAVLVNHVGEKVSFFSEELTDEVLMKINASKRKAIIFECEFFAVFCAMCLWKGKLAGCNVVIHTDNDGVRDSFISCHTTSANALPILNACLQLEFEAAWNPWSTWITRVPTESNIADNPSRFDVTSLIQSGCVKIPFDPRSMLQIMSDGNWGGTAT